ncbi:MAG: HD domain-containing protein [Ktedonobacterales bacterium]|nr:HD domain-containing protein [Ktedonobacterales bacterium]
MPSETGHDLAASLALAAEIGAALTATATLPELVMALNVHLKWLLPATQAALCLIEEDAPNFRRITRQHETTEPLGTDALSWSLTTATGVAIPDLAAAEGYPPGTSPAGSGTLLCLPLVSNCGFIGALALHSPKPGVFAAIDRGLLHLIAHQVAAAVQVALLMDELDNAEAVIQGMARALEARDAYTAGHSDRVTEYAVALAEAAGVSFAMRSIIARSGRMHDIGKIGVPDAILLKPERLTDAEFAIIQRHPLVGDEICQPLQSLQRLRAGVRHHHERYDGKGYPDGLAGEDIPLPGRILAIADTFDAMTSSRPYRPGMPVARAMSILVANEGPQWDPALVAIFATLRLLEDAQPRAA